MIVAFSNKYESLELRGAKLHTFCCPSILMWLWYQVKSIQCILQNFIFPFMAILKRIIIYRINFQQQPTF